MDLFLNWFSHEPGLRDFEFCDSLKVYLDALSTRDEIAGYRLTRRMLAFGPRELGEPSSHAAVNQSVCDLQAALYRDFADEQRVRGQEGFQRGAAR
jgi:hypothetical protein